MNICYVDTSALVKRYVDEAGSAWLRALLDPILEPLVILSHLAIAEMSSALHRRLDEDSVSPEDYARLQAAFRSDCLNEYRFFPVSQTVIDLACDLIERHALRTLDAIHLATCLSARQLLAVQGLSEMTLISADDHLLAAAASENVMTENPNHHL